MRQQRARGRGIGPAQMRLCKIVGAGAVCVGGSCLEEEGLEAAARVLDALEHRCRLAEEGVLPRRFHSPLHLPSGAFRVHRGGSSNSSENSALSAKKVQCRATASKI